MKRNNVINTIKRLYQLEMDRHPKHAPSSDFAENLLCNLEELGMLPPPKDGLVLIKKKDDGELLLPLFSWEEE